MTKKTLITGATGFVGRHCLRPLLRSNHEVHATYRLRPPEDLANVHWHSVDLLESEQVSSLIAKVQPTHLLHVGWYVAHGEYWTSPLNLQWVSSSLHLLQQFALRGGKRVVTAGTCAEYDWDYGYCVENKTPLNPATLYGTSKGALRAIVEKYAEQVGISSAWGRIFFVYGPGEHPNRFVPSVICNLLAGKPASCTEGRQLRDFLYVQDLADAFVALLDSEVRGDVNLAGGQPTSLREVAGAIARKIGRTDLLALGAVAAKKSDPPLLVADVRRLTEQVGWKPTVELDRGLEETIRWWKNVLATS